MQPRRELLEVSKAIFKDMWDQRILQASEMAKAYKSDIAKLEKKIEGLLDRIVDASSDSIVSAYEKRISSMQREVLVLEEKSVTTHQPRGTFEQVFEPVFRFLASPSKIWRSGRFEWQKLVLKLTFAEELAYVRNEGFRTPKTTLPFNMLGEKTMHECKMADREGFEPSIRLPVYTRSRRAPSATRPPVHPFRIHPAGCAQYTQDAVKCKAPFRDFLRYPGSVWGPPGIPVPTRCEKHLAADEKGRPPGS